MTAKSPSPAFVDDTSHLLCSSLTSDAQQPMHRGVVSLVESILPFSFREFPARIRHKTRTSCMNNEHHSPNTPRRMRAWPKNVTLPPGVWQCFLIGFGWRILPAIFEGYAKFYCHPLWLYLSSR